MPQSVVINGGEVELVESVYGDCLDSKNFDEIDKRVILAPKNVDVLALNNMIINDKR